jgi:hypothetical protein
MNRLKLISKTAMYPKLKKKKGVGKPWLSYVYLR